MLPDKIFGLELGDAEYIRNAGGACRGTSCKSQPERKSVSVSKEERTHCALQSDPS